MDEKDDGILKSARGQPSELQKRTRGRLLLSTIVLIGSQRKVRFDLFLGCLLHCFMLFYLIVAFILIGEIALY